MIKKVFACFFLLLFFSSFLFPKPSLARCKCDKKETKQVKSIEALETLYKQSSDFRADFSQEVTTPGSFVATIGRLTGAVYFKKPGKIRWDYRKPDNKSYICNGSTLWIYRPDEGIVEIMKDFMASSSELMVGFLTGLGSISNEFEIKQIEIGELRGVALFPNLGGDLDWYELSAKDQVEAKRVGLERLYFGVDRSSNYLVDVIMVQDLGSQTHWRFSGYKFDQKLPDELFEFKIPKDVEIIRE